LNSSFSLILDWIYPRKCALCSLLSSRCPCQACLEAFQPQNSEFEPEPDGPLAYRASLYQYEGRAAQAVRRLKYDRSTALAETLAALMRDGYERLALDPDLIVPVPIHPSRRRARGFNQAELLCEALPKGRVDRMSLRRIRRTRPQVGLSREERLKNLDGAFLATPSAAGKRVLLVDDVVTSGGTARACAQALRAAGAIEVGILAFAGERKADSRTPNTHHPTPNT
jgi:ComF family protein